MEMTGISWADYTYNKWAGCTKVSAGCDLCYAEVFDQRNGFDDTWGPHGTRRKIRHPGNPLKWNDEAKEAGVPRTVFAFSLGDVMDNHSSIEQEWRDEFWALPPKTPWLRWLVLTKRPQNFTKFLPKGWYESGGYDNVALGVSAEDQFTANQRVPILLNTPCKYRFVSAEPLLNEIDLRLIFREDPVAKGVNVYDALTGEVGFVYDDDDRIEENVYLHYPEDATFTNPKIDFVIAGGETGKGYREAYDDWYISLANQCKKTGTAFHFKQYGGVDQRAAKERGRELNGMYFNDLAEF